MLALPEDTPLTDLGALAGYDLSKLPDAKRAGEEIIRIIQQELLLRFGSKEVATIPEEEAQKLLVGVSTHILLVGIAIHPQLSRSSINVHMHLL